VDYGRGRAANSTTRAPRDEGRTGANGRGDAQGQLLPGERQGAPEVERAMPHDSSIRIPGLDRPPDERAELLIDQVLPVQPGELRGGDSAQLGQREPSREGEPNRVGLVPAC
jgi:hypothetical protein